MTSRTRIQDPSVQLIASRIRAYRILADLSMQEVGDTLDVTHSQIQKYELGISRVPADRLVTLAAALRVSVLDLLGVGDTNEVAELLEQITESGAGTLLRHYRCIESPGERARLIERAYAVATLK